MFGGYKMFSVGQNVLYGTNGVCVVNDITEKKVGKVSMEYYVLKPLDTNFSTLFVPTKNEALVKKIRGVMTKDMINGVLSKLPEPGEWNDNKQERSEQFKEVISNGDFTELIRMIRLIYKHSDELSELGRHLHMSDERLLKEAEKMVTEEIEFVLDVDKQQAIEMILK